MISLKMFFEKDDYGYCNAYSKDKSKILVCDTEYFYEDSFKVGEDVFIKEYENYYVNKNEYDFYMENSNKVYLQTFTLDQIQNLQGDYVSEEEAEEENEIEFDDKDKKSKRSKGSSGRSS